MNNRYDTLARIAWEKKRLGEPEDTYENVGHLRVHAKSEKEVGKNNYEYGQVSYENDLSNPAILFDNYLADRDKINKVYTEGMGTNTIADALSDGHSGEILKVRAYKADDPLGAALGVGESGIIERVARAVQQVVDKINTSKGEFIGTLTIDVFGFSRGSAAARHFVHEIMLPPHFAHASSTNNATPMYGVGSGSNVTVTIVDHSGNPVADKYFGEGCPPLPNHGRLGYLLSQKELTFDRLVIRFAGLFDTVAHHGVVQYNDRVDLGLDTITGVAKKIIHMTAGDEHRFNFGLSRILRKENHIELNMPGVHCDVGGSYVDGRPEGISPGVPPDPDGPHILAEDYAQPSFGSAKLSRFRDTLINEGWYTEQQIWIHNEIEDGHKLHPALKKGLWEDMRTVKFKLETQRACLSNQYSFIPLHMMCQYAIDDKLPFDFKKLTDKKDFKDDIIPGTTAFLQGIKQHLQEYAQQVFRSPTADLKYHIPEEDLRKLRNKYLHYNAVVGIVNMPEENRVRDGIKEY